MKRGDIYIADLTPTTGSEQGGIRPVLIIQNDVGNKHSPTVICAALTSKQYKHQLPTHVRLSHYESLHFNTMVLLEQLRTIDKKRLLSRRVCSITDSDMKKVDEALKISVGLEEEIK